MNTKDSPPESHGDGRTTQGLSLLKWLRRLIVFVVGMSVVVVGIVMIVAPGPAMIVIPAGLAILATEFVWAKRWLDYLKRRAKDAMDWTANSIGASNGSCKNEDESSTAASGNSK